MPSLLRSLTLTTIWLLGVANYALAQSHPALIVTIIPTTYANRLSSKAAISLEGGGHFYVLLTNTSSSSVTLFEEWNSWGYYGLSFDITYPDGRKVHAHKAARAWEANYPSTTTIAPQGSHVFEVSFDETWVNSIRLQPKSPLGLACSLRAIYSIGPANSPLLVGREVPAWTGTVESAELPCTVWL